ncbi:putative uncharacterized protein DDB_G0290521 [Gigantopelta aegis]|uniref:putative uncharacterized protein DDB_G0290521 n=1 Tax=Gigantopelta aegis TaxID=1735272 RepID=UPI001B888F33|nr:putative uncharacterized protein DDB_G0290521 [Gigantopelta aegis]
MLFHCHPVCSSTSSTPSSSYASSICPSSTPSSSYSSSICPSSTPSSSYASSICPSSTPSCSYASSICPSSPPPAPMPPPSFPAPSPPLSPSISAPPPTPSRALPHLDDVSSQVPPGSPMSVNTPVNHVPPTSMSPPPELLVQQTLSPPTIELSSTPFFTREEGYWCPDETKRNYSGKENGAEDKDLDDLLADLCKFEEDTLAQLIATSSTDLDDTAATSYKSDERHPSNKDTTSSDDFVKHMMSLQDTTQFVVDPSKALTAVQYKPPEKRERAGRAPTPTVKHTQTQNKYQKYSGNWFSLNRLHLLMLVETLYVL